MYKTARDRELILRGIVINEADGRGVHGIAVRLDTPKFLLAQSDPETLSHADGTFELPLRLRVAARCVLQFFPLQFFDRDRQLLHAQEISSDFFSPNALPLRVVLPAEKLGSHLSQPLSIARRSGRLVPETRLSILTHALSQLPNLDPARYTNLLFERRCPFPPLDRFENLLDDIWGTLDGDPAAHARFGDIIEVFSSASGVRGEPVLPSTRFIAQQNSSVEGDFDHLIREIQTTVGVWAPVEALLGRDTVIPLLLATAVVAGEERVVPAIRTMLGQLAAYRPLLALLSAAEQSLLSGDQKSEGYLLAMFQTLEDTCDFEEGLPPFKGPISSPWPDSRENRDQLLCIAEAIQASQRFFPLSKESYRIDTMEPARVCSGDTITLRGVRFTNTPHRVEFSGTSDSGSPTRAVVDPISWTDTEIVVTVPAGAPCGQINLLIPEACVTVKVCNTYQDICSYRHAERVFLFNGCQPRIEFPGFAAGVKHCVTLGSTRSISWIVAPEFAQTRLTIHEKVPGGTTIISNNNVGSSGSSSIDTSRIATYIYEFTATNPKSRCASVSRSLTITLELPLPTLNIVGVELTQGIQRFSLTGDTSLNNSVPMIANMDTIVRVFVASNRGPGVMPNARISGRMRFNGDWYSPINGNPPGSRPIITAGVMPSRSSVNDSLNFKIPAALARGSASLTIEVFTVDTSCGTNATVTTTRPIAWQDRKPFPVTVRRIAQPRSGDVLSESEALELINKAFDMLPSPRSEIRLFPGTFNIHPGTAEANYCNDFFGYYQLARSVAYEHNGVEGWAAWDPHETAWIGLYVRDCSPDGMMSWPHTTTCISEPDPEVAAHELAHTAGMGHTKTSAGEDCGTQPVPCYTLPDDGTLSDVVFDIRGNRVITRAVDLMSYRSGFGFPHPDHWILIRNLMDTRFP